MRTTRRKFLMGCSAAIAAMAGSRLGCFALSHPRDTSANREVLVLVFLRGGMDGLSLIPPIAGEDRQYYEEARRDIKIPVSAPGAALRLDDRFGLHPSAGSLHSLFQSGKLAIVQAVGNAGSRSHFDAMKYLELGTPGSKSMPTGWLARHLASSSAVPGTILASALATGISPPTSLQGSNETLNMSDPGALNLSQAGHWSWVFGGQRIALRRLYQGGNTFVHEAGLFRAHPSHSREFCRKQEFGNDQSGVGTKPSRHQLSHRTARGFHGAVGIPGDFGRRRGSI